MDTLLNIVFMKQYDLTPNDMAMVNQFANLILGISNMSMRLPGGTEVDCRPVWGGGDRSNHILGIFYQHSATEHHCLLKTRGVDAMQVDFNFPVHVLEGG